MFKEEDLIDKEAYSSLHAILFEEEASSALNLNTFVCKKERKP